MTLTSTWTKAFFLLIFAVALTGCEYINVSTTAGGIVLLNSIEECSFQNECVEPLVEGKSVEAIAFPREGHIFMGWSEESCGQNKTCNYEVTKEDVENGGVSIHASFIPDPTRFHIMGTQKSLDRAGLEAELSREGFILTNKTTIRNGECTIAYANADRDDLSADVGMLTCNRTIGDNATMTTKMVYGGCDIAQSQYGGGGSSCEVGVYSDELTLSAGNGVEIPLEVKAMGAEHCTAFSEEMTCMSVGADLISYSVGVKSESGTGVSAGVGIGVGAGVDGGYEDDVLSFGVDAKIGIGVSFEFSLNLEEDLRKPLVTLGKSGYLMIGGEFVAFGNSMVPFFNDLGDGFVALGEGFVSGAEDFGDVMVDFGDELGL